jgi:RNA polymerase sigma-70 factor (ECF subfamily)
MAFSFSSLVRDRSVSYDALPKITKSQVDRADLERQLDELHPASFAWALGCCGRDREDAEDVLQETYVKILEGKARFDGRSILKTWLFAVIRRTAAVHRRTRWFRYVTFAQPAVDAECTMLHSERTAELLHALARLARRQREVIELVFYHDMTIEQAAAVIGVSLGTARVHYQRGKHRLLQELQR